MLNAAVGIPAAAFVFIGLQFTGFSLLPDFVNAYPKIHP